MDWSDKLCFAAFLIAAAVIHGTSGDTMVTGTVFCDQCKDGQISLFDYPLYGIKVTMACPGSNGQLAAWREETTNWVGGYAMRFDGTPDLRGCYAQVSGGQGPSGCGAAAGPPKSLRLMFNMFDMEMYIVDPLISQPAQPMSFCPRSTSPVPAPVNPVLPPPATSFPPPPPVTRSTPLPPIPFVEASACPYQKWIMPEYRCHWKVVTPDTKVAVAFGLIAGRRYGTDLTLWRGLQGKGEAYKTLLREGTAALLNSYNSIQFAYHPLAVIEHMNWALMGSSEQVLSTALKFLRANAGNSHLSCTLSPCKS